MLVILLHVARPEPRYSDRGICNIFCNNLQSMKAYVLRIHDNPLDHIMSVVAPVLMLWFKLKKVSFPMTYTFIGLLKESESNKAFHFYLNTFFTTILFSCNWCLCLSFC